MKHLLFAFVSRSPRLLAWLVIASVGHPAAADTVPAMATAGTRSMAQRVVPAGGTAIVSPEVRQCGHVHRGEGPRCNGQCEGGGCPAHCPVRPSSFGYYGTQWRPWPTRGGAAPAGFTEATPVLPPRSAVPGVSEESLRTPSADQAEEPATDDRPPETEPLPPAGTQGPAEDAGRDAAAGQAGAQSRLEAVPDRRPPGEQATPEPSGEKAPATPDADQQGEKQGEKQDGKQDGKQGEGPGRDEKKPDGRTNEKDVDNLFDEARHGLRRQEMHAVLQQRAAGHFRRSLATAAPAVAARVDGDGEGVLLASHPDGFGDAADAEATPSERAGKRTAASGANPMTGSPARAAPPRGLRAIGAAGAGNPLR